MSRLTLPQPEMGGNAIGIQFDASRISNRIDPVTEHGCVILNDRAGQMKYSLPDPKNI